MRPIVLKLEEEDVTEDFLDWARQEVERLKAKYLLQEWEIKLEIVPQSELDKGNAAEVLIREPYRWAMIGLSEDFITRDRRLLARMLEHEVQHIALYPLDALKSLVIDAVDDRLKLAMAGEFNRANERVRALLGRLLKR